jgi:hypothetical protein
MLIPTKFDNLNYNPMILASHVLRFVRKSHRSFDESFAYINKRFNIDLNHFYNVLTFLWLFDLIEVTNNKIYYRGNNVLKKTLH